MDWAGFATASSTDRPSGHSNTTGFHRDEARDPFVLADRLETEIGAAAPHGGGRMAACGSCL